MGDRPPQPGTQIPQSQPDYLTQAAAGYAAGDSSAPQQHWQNAPSTQSNMAQPQSPSRARPYDMNAMATALPQLSYRPGQYVHGQQRYDQVLASSPNLASQVAVSQFGPQHAMNPITHHHYYVPQHGSMGQYYTTLVSPTQSQAGIANMQPRTNMSYYPATVMVNQPPQAPPYYYTQAAQYHPQPNPLAQQMMVAPYIASTGPPNDVRMVHAQPADQQESVSMLPLEHTDVDNGPGIVRGPPRKPRQSGHAIWIGNLPPQTDLMNLVHHVCKESGALESLFLISKSNCAFANFKDEASCVAAQQKLHDSKFQSVRLVSRLRKSTVEGATGVTAPTGPSASATQQGLTPDTRDSVDSESSPEIVQGGGVGEVPTTSPEILPQKDKFFILKSLTVEDLELSVRTSIWATQSHNEETLNKAFKDADNVYLVFSANKSGEYFGYARMVSPMNDDPAAAIEFAPKAQSTTDSDLPKAIPTEATDFAPKGRIIDDSARGTIFWEAERDEQGLESILREEEPVSAVDGGTEDSVSVMSGAEGRDSEPKAWGKPFKLEWLSTTKLPFYRTRGLRNPWNSNREVKIARDGTELEPSVGRRLIGMFNRAQSPALGADSGGIRAMMPILPGYPPVRPTYQ